MSARRPLWPRREHENLVEAGAPWGPVRGLASPPPAGGAGWRKGGGVEGSRRGAPRRRFFHREQGGAERVLERGDVDRQGARPRAGGWAGQPARRGRGRAPCRRRAVRKDHRDDRGAFGPVARIRRRGRGRSLRAKWRPALRRRLRRGRRSASPRAKGAGAGEEAGWTIFRGPPSNEAGPERVHIVARDGGEGAEFRVGLVRRREEGPPGLGASKEAGGVLRRGRSAQ